MAVSAWERIALRVTVSAAVTVPIAAGAAGIVLGAGLLPDGSELGRDGASHWRYLSGLLLGIGIAFASTIPRIETAGVLFRGLTLIVIVGGLARLWSLLADGTPSTAMLMALAMELLVTPGLALWRERVASVG